jgi:hypothetical protein
MTQSHPSQQQPGQKPGPIEWKPKTIRKGLTHPDAKRVQEVENGTTVKNYFVYFSITVGAKYWTLAS